MTDDFIDLINSVEAASNIPPIYYLPRLELVPTGTKNFPLVNIQEINTLHVFGVTEDNKPIELPDNGWYVTYDDGYRVTITNTQYTCYLIKYYRVYKDYENGMFEVHLNK